MQIYFEYTKLKGHDSKNVCCDSHWKKSIIGIEKKCRKNDFLFAINNYTNAVYYLERIELLKFKRYSENKHSDCKYKLIYNF